MTKINACITSSVIEVFAALFTDFKEVKALQVILQIIYLSFFPKQKKNILKGLSYEIDFKNVDEN